MAASSAHSSIAMTTSGFNDPSDADYRSNPIVWKDCDGTEAGWCRKRCGTNGECHSVLICTV